MDTMPVDTSSVAKAATAAMTAPAFLLIGDSHAGAIGEAARARGLAFCGGPIGSGRDFFAPFFVVRDGDPVFRDEDAERLYRGFLEALSVGSLAQVGVPLLSTIGSSLHFPGVSESWRLHAPPGEDPSDAFFASPLFERIAEAVLAEMLAFHRHARVCGLRTLFALAPQRRPETAMKRACLALQDIAVDRLRAIGVEIVDCRATTADAAGDQLAEFSETGDPIHGNLAFGAHVLDRALELLAENAVAAGATAG